MNAERVRRYRTWAAVAAFTVFLLLETSAILAVAVSLSLRNFTAAWAAMAAFLLLGGLMAFVLLRYQATFDSYLETDRSVSAWIRHKTPAGETLIRRTDVVDIRDDGHRLVVASDGATISLTRQYVGFSALRGALTNWRRDHEPVRCE